MRANICPVSRSTLIPSATASPAVRAVDARRDEAIADADVGGGRGEAELGRAAGAVAEHHAADAAALDLHRHGMLAVGDERHLRHRGEHARDLADHALIVEHGVAGLSRRRCPC
jgi:hypothetical protein